MSGKDDYIYCDKEKKIIGTYVYQVRPPHLEFKPFPGVIVNDALKAALDLATSLKTEVKFSINDINLSVPNYRNTTLQKLRRDYLRLLRLRSK